jgi:hypothetical protein
MACLPAKAMIITSSIKAYSQLIIAERHELSNELVIKRVLGC